VARSGTGKAASEMRRRRRSRRVKFKILRSTKKHKIRLCTWRLKRKANPSELLAKLAASTKPFFGQ
jgi:hypothetical protein